MRYRQSLHYNGYAEKYGCQPREPEVANKAGRTSTSGKPAGTGSVESPGLPVPAASQPSQSARGGRTGAHPGTCVAETRSWGMIELLAPAKKRGYTRCPESLFRVMKAGHVSSPEVQESLLPKPYEQMTSPGQRVQIDVKGCSKALYADPELKLFQYTAIDEFLRPALPGRLRGTVRFYSSADLVEKGHQLWFKRRGVTVGMCSDRQWLLNLPTASSNSKRDIPYSLGTLRRQVRHPSQAYSIIHSTP